MPGRNYNIWNECVRAGMVLTTLTKRASEPFRYKDNDLNVLASIDYKSSFQSQHLYYGFTNFTNSLVAQNVLNM